jgi:hypothetical protein
MHEGLDASKAQQTTESGSEASGVPGAQVASQESPSQYLRSKLKERGLSPEEIDEKINGIARRVLTRLAAEAAVSSSDLVASLAQADEDLVAGRIKPLSGFIIEELTEQNIETGDK